MSHSVLAIGKGFLIQMLSLFPYSFAILNYSPVLSFPSGREARPIAWIQSSFLACSRWETCFGLLFHGDFHRRFLAGCQLLLLVLFHMRCWEPSEGCWAPWAPSVWHPWEHIPDSGLSVPGEGCAGTSRVCCHCGLWEEGLPSKAGAVCEEPEGKCEIPALP